MSDLRAYRLNRTLTAAYLLLLFTASGLTEQRPAAAFTVLTFATIAYLTARLAVAACCRPQQEVRWADLFELAPAPSRIGGGR